MLAHKLAVLLTMSFSDQKFSSGRYVGSQHRGRLGLFQRLDFDWRAIWRVGILHCSGSIDIVLISNNNRSTSIGFTRISFASTSARLKAVTTITWDVGKLRILIAGCEIPKPSITGISSRE